jgi:molybdenum cofactor synthesis domain-containing protein
MRPIKETIPFDRARAIIAETIRPIDATEVVSIAEAHGRIVSKEVRSPIDVPPFARASMDGYAVIAEDTFAAGRSSPVALQIIEQVYTGAVGGESVTRGTCVEIATGAPMPPGADAVVQVEETEPESPGAVRILTPVHPGQNVGRQGADIARDQVALQAGDVLTPARVGVLAALGLREVGVFCRPRVAILSTGNEIVEPGRDLRPGQIYDVNRFTLNAIVAQHGGVPVPFATSEDTLDALEAAVSSCLGCDLIVFSGGSSVGDRDLILDLIAKRGQVLFHGIALKPGKPTALALVEGRPFFGMPGYPTSCLSNAYVLLVPALRQMARLPDVAPRSVTVPLARRIVSTTGRHQIYTVRVVNGQAEPAFKASGDITSMSQADGYIEIPAQTDIVEQGTLVDVRLF